MSDPGGNQKIVEDYYAAIAVWDLNALLRTVSPNIVLHEAPSLPYGGVPRGHEGWKRLFEQFQKLWSPASVIPLRMFAKGDEVVVIARFDCTARTPGVRVDLLIAELFPVQDRQIIELRPFYFDNTAVIEATRQN